MKAKKVSKQALLLMALSIIMSQIQSFWTVPTSLMNVSTQVLDRETSFVDSLWYHFLRLRATQYASRHSPPAILQTSASGFIIFLHVFFKKINKKEQSLLTHATWLCWLQCMISRGALSNMQAVDISSKAAWHAALRWRVISPGINDPSL